MRRSIRWHLLLNSLAVSLIAIFAVGVVTLLLVRSYFNRQEEQYLRDRGDDLIPRLETALLRGSDADLQQIASLGLLAGHIRIRIVDRHGRLLADSGSFDDLTVAGLLPDRKAPLTAFQIYLDDLGRLQGFGLPFNDEQVLSEFLRGAPIWLPEDQLLQPIAPAPGAPTTVVSKAEVRLPLRVNDRLAGYAELSEGPAYGQIIRDSIWRALIIGGIVAIAVAALAAVVSARQVTKPLTSLGSAASEMARGNLEARADGSKLKEIDTLASQFNRMASQLSDIIATLEADRAALRRFIADASHELRTPLTALKTFNELLAQDPANHSEPTATFIGESGRQLNQLDRLTSDLLDLSRYEARLSGADFVFGDIRPVVQKTVQDLKPLSEAKNQRLELIVPPTAVTLDHDPTSLQRAVSNLLSNALKYTPDSGRVQLTLKTDATNAFINIRDNGLGIPREEQVYIFDRFYRGRGISESGSGLGLSIAREIAEIHGGSISFVSHEGEGSLFTLSLPLKSRG